MKTFTRNCVGTLLSGVLITSAANLHAALVVDHFNSPVGGQGVSISNGIVATSQDDVRTGLVTVLGGSRELFLQLQAIYDPANYPKRENGKLAKGAQVTQYQGHG